jgi:hypothetical protein
MSILSNRIIVIALKLYVCVALMVAAVLSNPITSVAAVLALLVYLFFQWRPINVFTNLITNYFVFFAIAILLEPATNFVISNLISLPVLFLVTNSLLNTANFIPRRITGYSRSLTQVGMMLPFIVLVNLIIALFLSNFALLLASSVAIVYLGILILVSITGLSIKSVTMEQIQQRIIAGATADLVINLHSKTRVGGVLYIESPYEWLKIHSPIIPLKQEPLILRLSLSPRLSGPSEVVVQAYATDCWGLTQVRFQLSPIQLFLEPDMPVGWRRDIWTQLNLGCYP